MKLIKDDLFTVYEILFKNSSDAVLVIKDEKFIECNDRAVSMLGFNSKEQLQNTHPSEISPEFQPDGVRSKDKTDEIFSSMKEKDVYTFNWVHKKLDATDLELEVTLSKINIDNSDVYHVVWKDITKENQIIKNLQDTKYNLEQYLEAIDKIEIGLFVVNEDFSIQYMNKTMIKWFGDQQGKICYSSVAGLDEPCPYCKLQDVILENKKVIYEPSTSDGKSFDIVATSIKNSDGSVSKMEVIRNVTDKKLAQQHLLEQKEKLQHQAEHDFLTGLPNRILFSDRLSQAIEKSKRDNTKTALLFIDLDHFKEINDSLGHDTGDKVLQNVSKKLLSAIRDEDTLARFGGDEFGVILQGLTNAADASKAAQKILDSLKEIILIDTHKLYVSSSIGISIYPSDSRDMKNLLKYADAAMYRAKENGRNNFQYYSPEMTELAFERILMEVSLREALKKEQFVVYYQPQIDASSEKLVGMEALVRWQHPTMGIIPPVNFIPLAESIGLIKDLDRYVLKTAMSQIQEWQNKGLNPGVLSANMSVQELQDEYLEVLIQFLKSSNYNPKYLELEITESVIMKNPQEAINILQKISDIGISLAIDDFGTGYSSLSYLKKLPIDKLKIDRSFVMNLPDDEEDIAIVRAIIALANSLKLNLIAEGVETEEQKNLVLELGCKNIQGYYYSKPIPADEMEKLLLKYGI